MEKSNNTKKVRVQPWRTIRGAPVVTLRKHTDEDVHEDDGHAQAHEDQNHVNLSCWCPRVFPHHKSTLKKKTLDAEFSGLCRTLN